MNVEKQCRCRVCGKRYTLPQYLIDEGFFTDEQYYCEKHINKGGK